MSLSIRQWLEERHLELSRLTSPGAELSGVAFRLAQEMESKSLTPFDLCSLADVLELPLEIAQSYCQPLAHLTLALLRFLNRKKTLKRSEGTWLGFQIAYLRAFESLLAQEFEIHRPWISRGKIFWEQSPDEPLVHPQLHQLIKTLRPGRLTDSQAEQALSLIEESFLVQQINSLVTLWFRVHGAEEIEAKLLVQRLVNGLPGHLLTVIVEAPVALSQLQKFFFPGELSYKHTQQDRLSHPSINARITFQGGINPERELYRATLFKGLSEPIFGEPFSLQEIYVPPKGIPLTDKIIKDVLAPIDLEAWAQEQLQDTNSIAVIEGSSGLGKTSFCQVWAAWIARKSYPNWMPVLIRLQDVTLGETFEQTLESACAWGRFTAKDGWFSPGNPPCVLILDGLEDLKSSPWRSRSASALLVDQIIHFQSQNVRGNCRHKIFLTSRQSILTTLTRKYSRGNPFSPHQKFQRIKIQLFEQKQLQQWFKNWSKIQSKSIAQVYFTFLKQQGPFQRGFAHPKVADLVRQPLMLYLLGILHRERLIDSALFQLPLAQVKFEIYHRLCRWFLGESQENQFPSELVKEGLAHACRSSEAISNLLGDRSPEQFRLLLQKLALSLLQGNNPPEALSRTPLPALFFRHQASPRLRHSTELTFTHANLGSYLVAAEIARQLQQLVNQDRNRYGEITFHIQSSVEVAQHLYPLLGIQLFSQDLETLIIECLRQKHQQDSDLSFENSTELGMPKEHHLFSLEILFQRLEGFYHSYCRGQWMDLGIPQQMHSSLKSQASPLNVLQIDAIVGLNTLVLLSLIAQTASIPFFPCGHPNRLQGFDADRLLTLISHSALLSPQCFARQTRHCFKQVQLPGACLNDVFLAEIDFEEANLSLTELAGANLSRTNLTQANLSGASLVDANLVSANLSDTNLEGADLSGANLSGVNLSSANLKNACLEQAQLDEQMQNIAKANGAIFSWQEFQEHHNTLTTSDVTQTWSDEEFDIDETIQIESVEGELFIPEVVQDPFHTHSEDQEEESNYDADETLVASEYPDRLAAMTPADPQALEDDDITEVLE